MCILTNALLICAWASGIGAVRVEYPLAYTNFGTRGGYSFREDKAIGERVLPSYVKSGYDRGHLAAAADFGRDTNTLAATYLASNIAPMRPSVNRGRWARVEADARQLAYHYDCGLRCVVVPVYGGTNRTGRVAVPSAFLKVVYSNEVALAAWLEEQE